MLDAMRRGAGTWVVKIFLGVLVLSFAVWGIGDMEISQFEYEEAFRRDLSDLQRRLGGNIDAEQARQFGLAQQTLNRLVGQALYVLAARGLDLAVFFFNDPAATEIYTRSHHVARPS